jgi:tungstate transport system substrate-binding protein
MKNFFRGLTAVLAGFGLHDLDRRCFNSGRQHRSGRAGDDERRFVVCARAQVMRPRLFFSWLLVVLLWHASIAAEQSAPQSIILATTTSLDNSGLLAKILPVFTKETGITVHVLAQGTGQALQTAASDQADLVLAHDPEAEQEFITEGHGLDRSQVAWNDFIVVGPRSDPAHIGGSRDAVGALAAIASAQAFFVSRGDKSGTDALEHRLWRLAGIDPAKARDHSWYRDIGSGMRTALDAAQALHAYTITDRGTWLSFAKKGDLTVLVEGDPRLLNRYDVILLNPAKHPVPKQALARRLAAWLLSPEGQAAIGAYEVDGEQLFHPSAVFPK